MSIFSYPLFLSGKEVLPLIEGGKGISVSNGQSSGAWANAGGVGTFSGVNAHYAEGIYDGVRQLLRPVFKGKTRRERHDELIAQGIKGGITQAQIAHETAGGEGRIHMNLLWEMGGVERVLTGILDGAKGLIHGITCGAGMPYKLAEIATKYQVYYYPIVSSGRAFNALWKRAYAKYATYLGGVVYEDPWRAGGHNGLSNAEDPELPQDPFPRIAELRQKMNEVGLNKIPIIIAGGVWHLKEWANYIGNPEVWPVAFQFGTRPLVTKESPITDKWKQLLLKLKQGDVKLHRFSPTGFYSSAIKNKYLTELYERSQRQVGYAKELMKEFTQNIKLGPRGRDVFLTPEDAVKVAAWQELGYETSLKTPDDTLIFVTPEKAREIQEDQINCMGCLSQCSFSNWSQREPHNTGKKADPRSFCIQKTLQNVGGGADNIENELLFAGHNAYRFSEDPFYQNGFIPSVKELVERILTGR